MAAPKTQAQKGTQKRRMLGDQVVRAVLYNGRSIGQGKFMAAEVNGQLVLDDQGQPAQYRQTGTLV